MNYQLPFRRCVSAPGFLYFFSILIFDILYFIFHWKALACVFFSFWRGVRGRGGVGLTAVFDSFTEIYVGVFVPSLQLLI